MNQPKSTTEPTATRSAGGQLALIALTQIFGLSVWFSSSAVVPNLVRDWGISISDAAWLSMATQFGFAVGAIAASLIGLFDRFRPNRVLATSALCAAILTSGFAWVVSSLHMAVVIRFLLGICFAGIYPPGLKLTASWSLQSRSRSFGILGGCLTIGSSLPYLLKSLHDLQWQTLVGSTAVACALAGLLSLMFIKSGPFQDPPAPIDGRYAWHMFQEQGPRAACFGYFGHMFELYAVWTWLPIFMMHSLNETSITPMLGMSVFLCMGLGGFVGCLLGGVLADRFGQERVAIFALSISGACCVLSPFFFSTSVPALLAFSLIWGAAVIADSGLFSALLSSTADKRAVGTALSFQTAVGFLITISTIQLTPVLAEAFGWRYAFPYLVIGPIFGVLAIGAYRANSQRNVLL